MFLALKASTFQLRKRYYDFNTTVQHWVVRAVGERVKCQQIKSHSNEESVGDVKYKNLNVGQSSLKNEKRGQLSKKRLNSFFLAFEKIGSFFSYSPS